jgi:enediyne biosynthesis protein E4
MVLRLLQDSRWNVALTPVLAIIWFCAMSSASAQQPAASPLYGGSTATPQQSGSATGGTFAPVLDSERRPITAGGFVKEGPIVFQDVSEKAGLTSWHHKMGTPQKTFIIETTGSGVALLD